MRVKHKASEQPLTLEEAVWFICDRNAYDPASEVRVMLGRLLTHLYLKKVFDKSDVLEVLGKQFEGV